MASRFNVVSRRVVMVAAALAVALVARPLAAAQALPSGTELLAKMVAAIGGADAIKKVQSIRARGTFEIPAQGLSGSVEVLQGRPAQFRMTVDIQGIGQVMQGSDGKVAWSVDPMSGAQLLTGKAAANAIGEAQFDSQLYGPEHVKSATTVEKTTFGDRPAYKIKLVTTWGAESTVYIDAETSFMIGAEKVEESPMGAMPTITSSGGYQKFGPFMQPTTMVQTAMGIEQIVRDSRVAMIYEGTNTIQSLDLLGRKVLGNNGATLKKFGKKIAAFIEEEGTNEAMQEFTKPLAELGQKVQAFTNAIWRAQQFIKKSTPEQILASIERYVGSTSKDSNLLEIGELKEVSDWNGLITPESYARGEKVWYSELTGIKQPLKVEDAFADKFLKAAHAKYPA